MLVASSTILAWCGVAGPSRYFRRNANTMGTPKPWNFSRARNWFCITSSGKTWLTMSGTAASADFVRQVMFSSGSSLSAVPSGASESQPRGFGVGFGCGNFRGDQGFHVVVPVVEGDDASGDAWPYTEQGGIRILFFRHPRHMEQMPEMPIPRHKRRRIFGGAIFALTLEHAMHLRLFLPSACAIGMLAACASTTHGPSLLGDPAPVAAATRTIVLTPDTRWVNVTGGDIVKFVAGDKAFAWNFDVGAGTSSFDLNRVAPPGTLDHKITAYVAPDPRYIGGDGGHGHLGGSGHSGR